MKPLLFILLAATILLFAVRRLHAGEPAVSTHAIRVACVGDSITYGARIFNHEAKCYPAQLGVLLGTNYAVKNFGVNGATLLKHGIFRTGGRARSRRCRTSSRGDCGDKSRCQRCRSL